MGIASWCSLLYTSLPLGTGAKNRLRRFFAYPRKEERGERCVLRFDFKSTRNRTRMSYRAFLCESSIKVLVVFLCTRLCARAQWLGRS